MKKPVNKCLKCPSWNNRTLVCSYDECKECDDLLKIGCNGTCDSMNECRYPAKHGKDIPEIWNPNYRWSRGFEVTKDDEIKKLFHTLWTKAVGTKDYDKKEWQKLAQLLTPYNINVQ